MVPFCPRAGKFILGLSSNIHSWKSKFFFVGGEWATESDRDLLTSRWDTVPSTKLGKDSIFDFTSSCHIMLLLSDWFLF